MFQKKRKFKRRSFIFKKGKSPRFVNPRRAQRKTTLQNVFKYVNIALLVVIAYLAYFFIFSPFYEVDTVEVVGNEKISAIDIERVVQNYLDEKRFVIFKNSNMYTLSKAGLRERIGTYFIFNKLKINKEAPNLIRLEIEEKTPVLEYGSRGQVFLLDAEGLVIKKEFSKSRMSGIFAFEEIDPEDEVIEFSDGLPNIINLDEDETNIGDTVLSHEQVVDIIDFVNMKKDYEFLQVTQIGIPNNYPNFLEVLNSPNNWKLYLNLQDNIQKQLERLKVIVDEKITPEGLGNIEYIDLRMSENVYYK